MLEKIEERIKLINQQLQQALGQIPVMTDNLQKMKDHVAQLTGHINELNYIKDEIKKDQATSGSDEITLDIP